MIEGAVMRSFTPPLSLLTSTSPLNAVVALWRAVSLQDALARAGRGYR